MFRNEGGGEGARIQPAIKPYRKEINVPLNCWFRVAVGRRRYAAGPTLPDSGRVEALSFELVHERENLGDGGIFVVRDGMIHIDVAVQAPAPAVFSLR